MAHWSRRDQRNRRMTPTQLLRAMLAAEYVPGSDDHTWLRGLLQATEAFFDHGHGVMGWFFSSDTQFTPTAPAAINDADNLVDAALRVSIALGSSSLAAALAPTPCLVTASQAHGLGRDLLRNTAYREHAHPLGVRDFLALKAIGPSGRLGCLIGAPLADIASAASYQRTPWQLLVKHMSLGLGVRNSVESATAVFQGDGRLVHASGVSTDADSIEALRHAVLARERARRARSPEEAINLLNLSSDAMGSLSLIDQFESDGRRYVVARDNGLRSSIVSTDFPGLYQITNLEAFRDLDDVEQKIVCAMVTTRVANKQIAIDMGIGFRAFEKRVQRIADKLNIKVPRGGRVRPLLTRFLTSK